MTVERMVACMTDRYEGVDAIVRVDSDGDGTCKLCRETLCGLEDLVNHYIQVHKRRLLHVGGESVRGGGGQLWLVTVAVLGRVRKHGVSRRVTKE